VDADVEVMAIVVLPVGMVVAKVMMLVVPRDVLVEVTVDVPNNGLKEN